MKRSEVLFGVIRIPLDMLAVVAALLTAYRLREANIDLIPHLQLLPQATTLPDFSYYLENFVLWGVLLFVLLAALFRLYTLRVTLGAWREVGSIIIVSLLWLAAVIAWFFLVEKELFFSRIMLLHATFLSMLFVIMERGALLQFQRALLRRGIGVRRVASVGMQSLPASVERLLSGDVRFNFVGHFKELEDVRHIHVRNAFDLVLHTDAHPTSEKTAALIDYCRNQHIGYAFLPPVFCDVPHQLSVHHLGLVPLLRFDPTPLDGWGRVFKRLFDICVSLLLLLVLMPLFVLVTLLILFFNGSPVLYISKRVGQHARHVVPVIKFRTMKRNADQMKKKIIHMSHRHDGPLFKVKNDPRVTRLGRLLRRWTIDELPQLLNVLIGQMSLIGPRPHLPDEVSRYKDYQRRVFAVKPGMTGLAQVSGRSNLPFQEEVRLDMRYVEEWSFGLDLWILWRTAFVIFSDRGAD